MSAPDPFEIPVVGSRLQPYDPNYDSIPLPPPTVGSLYAQMRLANTYCRSDTGDPATAWVLQQYANHLRSNPTIESHDRLNQIQSYANRFRQYPGGRKTWHEFSRDCDSPNSGMMEELLQQLLSECRPPTPMNEGGSEEEHTYQNDDENEEDDHDDENKEETEEEFNAYLAELPTEVQAACRRP